MTGFASKSAPNSATKSHKERNVSRNLPKRSASSVGKSSTSGMGMRSISVGMLNQVNETLMKFILLLLTIILLLYFRVTLIKVSRYQEVDYSDQQFLLKIKLMAVRKPANTSIHVALLE